MRGRGRGTMQMQSSIQPQPWLSSDLPCETGQTQVDESQLLLSRLCHVHFCIRAPAAPLAYSPFLPPQDLETGSRIAGDPGEPVGLALSWGLPV